MPRHTTDDVAIVEDEAEFARSMADYLGAFKIRSRVYPDAESALTDLAGAADAAHPPRLLLLDVNLPGRSGFELCRTVRASADPVLAAVPILFLTARGSEDDEVLALSIGGDDYLRKPFSMGVLLAKIRRVLERSGSAPATADAAFDDGRLRIDPIAERVHLRGEELQLPAMEYRLLAFLVRERDRVVSKQELLDEVWHGGFVGDGTISVHVRRLRLKIEEDPEEPRYLRTVWGRGYLFTGGA